MDNFTYNGHKGLDGSAAHQLRENAGWLMGLGVVLVALGTLAVLFAFQSTIFSVIYLGSFLIVVGFFEVVKAFKVNKWSGTFLHLFLAALYAVSGGFLLYNPLINTLTLTLFLAGFFVASGIAKIIFALMYHVPHKGWLILNGILAVILGLLIWQQWPGSALWVIGTIVGIDAIMTGITWIMLGSRVRHVVPGNHHS